MPIASFANTTPMPPSALLLSDRLLRLAEAAEMAGCHTTAEHLLDLAHTVFDDAELAQAFNSRGAKRVLAS